MDEGERALDAPPDLLLGDRPIPGGELLTTPVPVPASVTVRANWLPLPELKLIEVVALLPLESIAIAVRVRGLKLPETELNVAV